MRVEDLKLRIEKANEKIAKIEKRITKYKNRENNLEIFIKEEASYYDVKGAKTIDDIAKARYNYFGGRDDIECCTSCILRDLDDYNQENVIELRSSNKALEEAKELLNKYNNMLEVELQKKEALNELPEVFVELKNYLIEQWDKFDLIRQEECKKRYSEITKLHDESYEEYKKQYKLWQVAYNYNGWDIMREDKEHIHSENVKSAEKVILDLIDRVSSITGEITSYANVHTNYNNNGFCILNGYVVGNSGTAKVESIYAGGYNIQKLHIRVLVHKVNA